jgi:hypothetical protein
MALRVRTTTAGTAGRSPPTPRPPHDSTTHSGPACACQHPPLPCTAGGLPNLATPVGSAAVALRTALHPASCSPAASPLLAVGTSAGIGGGSEERVPAPAVLWGPDITGGAAIGGGGDVWSGAPPGYVRNMVLAGPLPWGQIPVDRPPAQRRRKQVDVQDTVANTNLVGIFQHGGVAAGGIQGAEEAEAQQLFDSAARHWDKVCTGGGSWATGPRHVLRLVKEGGYVRSSTPNVAVFGCGKLSWLANTTELVFADLPQASIIGIDMLPMSGAERLGLDWTICLGSEGPCYCPVCLRNGMSSGASWRASWRRSRAGQV